MSAFLISRYKEYIPDVRSGSADIDSSFFKTKKEMWAQISVDILEEFGIRRTLEQCENRFKSILKRKKKKVASDSVEVPPSLRRRREEAVNNVTTTKNGNSSKYEVVYVNSGNSSVNYEPTYEIPNEDADEDDEKPLLKQLHKRPRQSNSTGYEEKSNAAAKTLNSAIGLKAVDPKRAQSGAQILRRTLLEIHAMKEENKDRRHRETMNMWERFFDSQSNN